MAPRDYAYRQVHSYQSPRKQIRRQHLKSEIIKKRLIFGSSLIGTACLLGALVYGAFWSPLFRIQSIAINGVPGPEQPPWLNLLRDYTGRKIWFIIPRNNYFLLSTAKTHQFLETSGDEIMMFYNFDIKKKWPNKLAVTFFERRPYMKVNYFYIDKEGIRLSDKAALDALTDSTNIQSVNYISDQITKVGESIFNPEFIKKIINVIKAFQDPDLPATVRFVINDNWSQIEVKTTAGFVIFLSLDHPLQDQLNYLRLVMQKVGDKRPELKYIDLRIKNRAYTCCNLDNMIEF